MNEGTPAWRPLWPALAVSLMLHLAAVAAPDLRSHVLRDENPKAMLDANLVVPMPVRPDALPKPASPPQKRRQKPVMPKLSAPVAPLAMAASEAALPAESASRQSDAMPPPERESVAVPPAPTFARASQWPQQGRIVFQVTRGEAGLIIGRSEHQWRHTESTYELRATTETTGLAALFRPVQMVQESRGLLDAAGLQPLEFRNERDGKPRDSAHIDIEQRKVLLGNGDSIAFAGPVQDILSLFYQLGTSTFDVPSFKLLVTTGRKLASYAVTVGEVMNLDTPVGERSVRHLTVLGAGREDATEVWLDTLTHLPMKIRHRDRKGEIFDQIVTTIELEPQ